MTLKYLCSLIEEGMFLISVCDIQFCLSMKLSNYCFRLLNCWTDEEINTATGDSERHLAVHPLKLNSSYATVKVPNYSFVAYFLY